MNTPSSEPAWTRLLRYLSLAESSPGADSSYFGDSHTRNLPYLPLAAVLFAIHLGAVRLGYLLLDNSGQVTRVWTDAALGLVTLLLFGTRYWPVLLLAYLAGGLQRHLPWWPCLGVALAGVARTLAGVWIFRRFAKFKKQPGPFDDLATLGITALVSPLISATIGTASQILGGLVPPHRWAAAVGTWWVGDMLGNPHLRATPSLLLGAAFLSRPDQAMECAPSRSRLWR